MWGGVEQDRVKTKTVSDNGFRPTWNEEFKLEIAMPELASLRLVVQDEDMFGDPNTIGQNVYPFGTKDEPSIRTGTMEMGVCIYIEREGDTQICRYIGINTYKPRATTKHELIRTL